MDESMKMDNTKVFNMIILGGLLRISPMVQLENVMRGLKKSLPERHHKLLPMNEQAILRGMEIVEHEQVAAVPAAQTH
jgi:2-oxoglutarate ferredoxin oxidoreductase subunit gamma